MKLEPVNSSNMHSAGCDETGQCVRYHTTTCQKRHVKGAACNCSGGPVYHHPGVPAELHQQMLAAPSVASFHHAQVKTAKCPKSGSLLYPCTKLEEKKEPAKGLDYTGI